ncbi:hypothetical protein O181_038500 [Austropuccinia psidii MF-1]|uniref:Uncharacterized protein n=1 Tax=Austropuccinia psidii MF-1 TaxID=1389203 RepID=A0A9Q3DD05_9BASI|nr:hypothetical protein [Austropuccinia psidii MF-1]
MPTLTLELASTSPPNPLQRWPHTHLILSAAYHPYSCMTARHSSNAAYHLNACGALPTCLQRCLPSLRLWSAFTRANFASITGN